MPPLFPVLQVPSRGLFLDKPSPEALGQLSPPGGGSELPSELRFGVLLKMIDWCCSTYCPS